MRRRRFRRRSNIVKRAPHGWANAITLRGALAAATTTTLDLVVPLDWQSDVLASTALLHRIVGTVSIVPTTVLDESACQLAIICIDEDEGNPDISAVATYINEDVLWTDTVEFPIGFTGSGYNRQLDIRVKRKLGLQSEIRLLMRPSNAAMEVTATMRSLITKR